jgi:hypothetical protein
MAFKLTYTDGQEQKYDDSTKWEIDDGVLKMGREPGKWSVLVSPSHWAVIEVGQDGEDRGEGEDRDEDKTEDRDTGDDKEDKEDKDNENKDKDDDR